MKHCQGDLDAKCVGGCDWEIQSPEHGDCFWVWVRAHSNDVGGMPNLSQVKIMELLNLPAAKATDRVNEALTELRSVLEPLGGSKWIAESATSGLEGV